MNVIIGTIINLIFAAALSNAGVVGHDTDSPTASPTYDDDYYCGYLYQPYEYSHDLCLKVIGEGSDSDVIISDPGCTKICPPEHGDYGLMKIYGTDLCLQASYGGGGRGNHHDSSSSSSYPDSSSDKYLHDSYDGGYGKGSGKGKGGRQRHRALHGKGGKGKGSSSNRNHHKLRDGSHMRAFPCDEDNKLQQFRWDKDNSDGQTLTLESHKYDDFCAVNRGHHANKKDPVIFKPCDDVYPDERKYWYLE